MQHPVAFEWNTSHSARRARLRAFEPTLVLVLVLFAQLLLHKIRIISLASENS
jgi:hypothetical protein